MNTEMKECPICHEYTDKFIPVRWNAWNKENNSLNWNYYICPNCGCLFLNCINSWNDNMYAELIYNKDYAKVDPAFNGLRSCRLFPHILSIIQNHTMNARILDYGGGNGLLVDLFRDVGIRESYCYDPYGRTDILEPENDSFNVVLAIEVLEHAINADELWREISDYIKKDGLFIATTELYKEQDLNEWTYINPRAGHCLIYTEKALKLIAEKYNFKYIKSIVAGDNELHIFKKH